MERISRQARFHPRPGIWRRGRRRMGSERVTARFNSMCCLRMRRTTQYWMHPIRPREALVREDWVSIVGRELDMWARVTDLNLLEDRDGWIWRVITQEAFDLVPIYCRQSLLVSMASSGSTVQICQILSQCEYWICLSLYFHYPCINTKWRTPIKLGYAGWGPHALVDICTLLRFGRDIPNAIMETKKYPYYIQYQHKVDPALRFKATAVKVTVQMLCISDTKKSLLCCWWTVIDKAEGCTPKPDSCLYLARPLLVLLRYISRPTPRYIAVWTISAGEAWRAQLYVV